MGRQWPGLSERIGQRIKALGFKNAAQFADAKGYRITYIYKWAGGTTPDRENLERLAKDLEVHPAWLLFGDEIGPLLKRAGRRVLTVLLAALAIASLSVRAEASPLQVGDQLPDTRYYVNRRRRGWPWRLPYLALVSRCHTRMAPIGDILPSRA